MTWLAFITDPLAGRASLARVFWLYGIVGSLAYGALEFWVDPGNAIAMRLYVVGGLLFSAYTAVCTYRCAGNCRSQALGRMARISAVCSLVLLPVIAYLELTDAVDVSLGGVL